jgi:putative (di)nucleoside polyphosphate hydrolase
MSDEFYRPNVGILLLNKHGKLFVARRIDMAAEAWQMPQGGIDEGEEPRKAALRELEEEIGTKKAEIIAEGREWIRYDVPAEIARKLWGGRWRGQRQKWFAMRFTGKDKHIDLDTKHPEFCEWKWIDPEEAPRLIVPFKRPLYEQVIAEFRHLWEKPA